MTLTEDLEAEFTKEAKNLTNTKERLIAEKFYYLGITKYQEKQIERLKRKI